ncbi:MAG: hypothetical protein LQ344_002460 [Seirophora lacunosa]|nr:MAG: hypothetical protein LQ344_002460 [Seirophora lacunosa]
MAARTYNEYLDAGHSEDEEPSHRDSDDAQEVKGKITQSKNRTKRRKIHQESSGEGSEDETTLVPDPSFPKNPEIPSPSSKPAVADESTPREDSLHQPPPAKTLRSRKPSASTTTKKPGVIYLSRIPPFMRPSTVRHLLSPFGPITKLFLTPEPPAQHTSRVRAGGNKKRSFIDGWIEFADHKHAKTCVAAINGHTMGGRGWYRDDVWNAKYLRGFAWDDLMAGVRAEEREREERVRVGVRREKREREEFLKGVERGRVQETKKRKKMRKGKGEEDGGLEGVEGGRKGGFERRFRQNEVKKKRETEDQPDEVRRVLSKIF